MNKNIEPGSRRVFEGIMNAMGLGLAIIVVALLLSGCVPYIEGGVGYSQETGEYYGTPTAPIDERGVTGHWAIGVESLEERWYTPTYCEFRHRSMVDKRPEIWTEDFLCVKRIYLGRQP